MKLLTSENTKELLELDFPFKVISSSTGHFYIRPMNNLKPFSQSEENNILDALSQFGYWGIRNTVLKNYSTKETEIGYGFRVFKL